MDLTNIHNILSQLFSDGYQVNAIKVKCETPTNVKITNNIDNIYFSFENKLPIAEVNKFVTFKLYIEGISFGQTGGVIKLKNFPDMPFNYESNKTFGDIQELKFENFDEEINATFKSQSKRKIASKCLQYAQDWATISSLNGVRFDKCDQFDYFVLKNKCYYFVEDQIKNDTELQYGAFISIFILGIILPAIIKWAVERIIRSLLT
jgi:hypothetical protein